MDECVELDARMTILFIDGATGLHFADEMTALLSTTWHLCEEDFPDSLKDKGEKITPKLLQSP